MYLRTRPAPQIPTLLSGSIIQTSGIDGDLRHWGVCKSCGHIDELCAKEVAPRTFDPYCQACVDDREYQAEQERTHRSKLGVEMF